MYICNIRGTRIGLGITNRIQTAQEQHINQRNSKYAGKHSPVNTDDHEAPFNKKRKLGINNDLSFPFDNNSDFPITTNFPPKINLTSDQKELAERLRQQGANYMGNIDYNDKFNDATLATTTTSNPFLGVNAGYAAGNEILIHNQSASMAIAKETHAMINAQQQQQRQELRRQQQQQQQQHHSSVHSHSNEPTNAQDKVNFGLICLFCFLDCILFFGLYFVFWIVFYFFVFFCITECEDRMGFMVFIRNGINKW